MNIALIKRRIGILTNKSSLRPLLKSLNLLFFHWSKRRHTLHPGSNDETILVIRPQTNSQGLLSSYLHVLKHVRWAIENHVKPYVDFESSDCQYFTGRVVRGSKNAWEYYFCQPSSIGKSDILSARNVIYSGWSLMKKYEPCPIPKLPETVNCQELVSIAKKCCPVKEYIKEMVNELYDSLFYGVVLGVFLRGTDYVKLQPKGHARQPDLLSVIQKIDQYIERYQIDRIFLVTEDFNYYHALKEKYGEKVFSSDDSFIRSYNSIDYVGDVFKNDAYDRGLSYLIRILLYGRCDYTISGITNGSIVAGLLKEKTPIDSYWFDLGVY